MSDSKICSKCKEEKPLEEFQKRGNTLRGECKECNHNRMAKWRKENREKIKGYQKKYYSNNKSAIQERVKKWRAENPEPYKDIQRKYYHSKLKYDKERQEYMKEYIRDYYRNNREEILNSCREYRAKNKERIRLRDKKYIEDLRTGYLKNELIKAGFSKELLDRYPEIIQTKREILKIYRFIKQHQ